MSPGSASSQGMGGSSVMAGAATDDGEGSAANSRLLRKRELDRKAQRLARERTKNRIAHLEATIESLMGNDINSQVSTLMEQLAKVTQERDNLIEFLGSLNQRIQRQLAAPGPRSFNAGASIENTIRSQPVHDMLTWSSFVNSDQTQADSTSQAVQSALSVQDCLDSVGAQLQESQELFNDPRQYSPREKDKPSTIGHRANVVTAENSGTSPIQGLDDVIVPKPALMCECVSNSCPSQQQLISRNTWRAANEALRGPETLSPHDIMFEDLTSQDTPVRAVVEGWDSVERAGQMTCLWQKLKRIDEVCFKTCQQVERMAILRMMHLLLLCHSDPDPKRINDLPRWYWMRPSQTIAHSYAIDFFVWPGVRERFVFSQHQYCTNIFWERFSACIKILWPYGLRDAYLANAEHNRYQISPLFEQQIRDINAWTMSRDFFSRFPDLCEDIPMYLSLPPNITNKVSHASYVWPTSRRIEEEEEETWQLQGIQSLEGDGTGSSLAMMTAQWDAHDN